jgi:cyclic pyranopterin phosphate synthase
LRSGATDEDLEKIIGGMWGARDDRYSEERSSMTEPQRKVEMYHIGG